MQLSLWLLRVGIWPFFKDLQIYGQSETTMLDASFVRASADVLCHNCCSIKLECSSARSVILSDQRLAQ